MLEPGLMLVPKLVGAVKLLPAGAKAALGDAEALGRSDASVGE